VALIERSEKIEKQVAQLAKETSNEYAKAKSGYVDMLQGLVNRRQIDTEIYRALRDDLDKTFPSAPMVRDIETANEKRLLAVLGATKIASVRTDSNGMYWLKDVARGKYYLYAKYKIFESETSWLVPIELKGERQTIDFSNSNSGWFSKG
jgi:hypothetical protein